MMKKATRCHIIYLLLTFFALHSSLFTLESCIEPPLKLPAQELAVDVQVAVTDIDVVWNVSADWRVEWYYGWDAIDVEHWGQIAYHEPTSYEVRRYFIGDAMGAPHMDVDAFTINETSFRRAFMFGYYDILLWSNIDSPTQTQTVIINEDDIDNVVATTSVTRALSLSVDDNEHLLALYNAPDVFYSAYARDIHISTNVEDYDYFNEQENVWVKRINCILEPLTYIYLVQVVLHNNNGKVKNVGGSFAMSGLADATSVNTGQTSDTQCMVYFPSRMKQHIKVRGEDVDIIGGKLTTYGLCGMKGYSMASGNQYDGTHNDYANKLFVDFELANGDVVVKSYDVSLQMQAQCHGGVITVDVDCNDIRFESEDGPSGLFHPEVEDYEHLEFDIPL